jgi:hypothetical protein
MVLQFNRLQYLTYQICKYLYGKCFNSELIYRAIKTQKNYAEILALLLLHHNRRHVGLFSLYYQYTFSICKSLEDYIKYFEELYIIPPYLLQDEEIIRCYYQRYDNYYHSIQRLLYDDDVDLWKMSSGEIIDYCYSNYMKTYAQNINDIFCINDEYHNVTYFHYGKVYTISVRHLLLSLLENVEPHTQQPFENSIYQKLCQKYNKELLIFNSYYQ